METLNGLSKEDYNNYKSCLKYLNENKTIGNEDAEYNGIFHVHWRGPIDNNKVTFQIKSILATQYVTKIYFWIENLLTTLQSRCYPNLAQLAKYVQIRVFDKSIMDKLDSPYKEQIWNIYALNNGDRRYRTDIFRWCILNIYGGTYSDADTLFLRDIRDIKIKNWSAKWAQDDYAEACILHLEQGNKVAENIYLNNPYDARCFLMMINDMPEAYSYKHKNLDFTSLPSYFFDIIWGHEHCQGERGIMLKNVKMKTFDDFFTKMNIDITLDEFFPGCFTYHWHNRWDAPELKDSIAGKLNEDIDRIIKEKYNITPAKIFTL